MIDKLTKKRVLQASTIGAAITSLLAYIFFNTSTSICPYEITFDCTILSLISLPILLFSLITYNMRDEVFLSWKKFSFIYLFIYLFIVLISPWMHADFSPFEKKSNALFLVALYSAISLILIAYKSYQLRKK